MVAIRNMATLTHAIHIFMENSTMMTSGEEHHDPHHDHDPVHETDHDGGHHTEHHDDNHGHHGDHHGGDAGDPIVSAYVTQIFITVNFCVIGAVINLVGTVANTINIIVFLKMGFNETINIGLFCLAIADVLCLLTLLWLSISFNPLFVHSGIPFKSDEVEYLTAGLPHICLSRITGLITAYITFERCLCVILPLKVKDILTPKRTFLVMVAIYISMIASMSPAYTVHDLGPKFYPSFNRSMIGVVLVGNTHFVMKVTYALNTVHANVTFAVVIVCTMVLVKKLYANTKWRRDVTKSGESNEEGTSLSKKDQRVVSMVTMISTVFLICFFPTTVFLVVSGAIPDFSHHGKYNNLFTLLFTISFPLESFNSSVNFFIYMKMSSKFRQTFNSMFRRQPTV